jgi:hypothetical protein
MFMRTILTAAMVLCSCAVAGGDVGYVELNQANQIERAGDWFRISTKSDDGKLVQVQVFVKKRTTDEFQGASLQLNDGAKVIAIVPLNVKPAKNDAGYYIDFVVASERVKECFLILGVEHHLKDGLSVGTSFHVDVGSYAK